MRLFTLQGVHELQLCSVRALLTSLETILRLPDAQRDSAAALWLR